jgi:hypothetical protein
MDRGPVLSHVFNLITDEAEPNTESLWSRAISEPERHEVRLNKDIELEELSDAEVKVLTEIFTQYGKMTRWELVEFTHKLPEWTDPQGSAFPISYRDILRAEGKTESEIAAIEDELAELTRSISFSQPRGDALAPATLAAGRQLPHTKARAKH